MNTNELLNLDIQDLKKKVNLICNFPSNNIKSNSSSSILKLNKTTTNYKQLFLKYSKCIFIPFCISVLLILLKPKFIIKKNKKVSYKKVLILTMFIMIVCCIFTSLYV